MPRTKTFEFGDLVTVAFPFTDDSGIKVRPAAVVSNRRYHTARKDVVLAAVTGRIRDPSGFGEVRVAEWERAGLLKESVVKPVLFTVERSLVRKRLGRMAAEDRKALDAMLGEILG